MTPLPVEAVFVVFYGPAAHKATYGRDVDDNSYTKDYIQLPQDPTFRELLEQLFPRAHAGDNSTNIQYKWPGGQSKGQVQFESADRPHLAWLRSEGAPKAWKMTPSPSESTVETIPGDPTGTDTATADGQLSSLVAAGAQPYLVAVKLRGDPLALHLRVYIENPPQDLEFASVDLLPDPVRDLVTKATKNRAFRWAALESSSSAIVPPEIAEAVQHLDENPSLLLIGPPGTGKTVLLEQLVDYVENPGRGIFFDPDERSDAWTEATGTSAGKTSSVVLHPSYQYDNLVVGLLPEPRDSGGVGVHVSTGPLVNLAHYASQDGRRALLVLDEFNRANAAAVLGDALALLDKDKRGRAHIDLPYSDLQVRVPDAYEANGTTVVDSHFTLPPTLWIVAAMNTSDRSVAPLDAALRRRFTIVEKQPDYDLLAQHVEADTDADLSAPSADWSIGHVGKLAVELLQELNRRVDAVLGIDFRLGHSNFWSVGGATVEAALLSLASAFDHKVVQTLRLSLQDDDPALAVILRAGTPESPKGGSDAAAHWVKADPELGTFAADRLHLREISALTPAHMQTELLRQARL